MELQETPPWQKNECRNTSLSSTNFYGTLSPTDTSLEMGPRSLSTMSSSQISTSSSSSLSMDFAQPSSSGQHSTTPTSPDQSKSSVGHVQSPQQLPQSHGSPSGSSQSTAAACFHPSDQPRLEPTHISMPPKAQVVYPVTSKVVSGVEFQPSGKKNIVHSTGKNAGHYVDQGRLLCCK